MGAAQIQLIGNVATTLKQSLDNPGHERVSFRVIANDRRFDAATNTWVDGDEFSVTVVCWGSLAKGVAQSVLIGDPVVVNGKILNRRYEVEGETRYTTEVKAVTVSHDLARGTATFRKIHHRPVAENESVQQESYEVRESPEAVIEVQDPYALTDAEKAELKPAEFAGSSNGGADF